jgi:hypothetical protein
MVVLTMGKRAIKKGKHARTDMTFEGMNVQLKGSAAQLNRTLNAPTGEKTGYPNKADSTKLKTKPNLEQTAEIDPDTSQGDI